MVYYCTYLVINGLNCLGWRLISVGIDSKLPHDIQIGPCQGNSLLNNLAAANIKWRVLQ